MVNCAKKNQNKFEIIYTNCEIQVKICVKVYNSIITKSVLYFRKQRKKLLNLWC